MGRGEAGTSVKVWFFGLLVVRVIRKVRVTGWSDAMSLGFCCDDFGVTGGEGD